MSDLGDIAGEDRRLAEAAAWRVRLTEIEAESTPEFETWLEEPGSDRAWARVTGPWNYLSEHANAPELVVARKAALGDAQRAGELSRIPRDWRRIARACAAMLVIAILAVGGAYWWQRPADYTTAFGERRVITLADGSRISLDSDSEVTVRYSRNARELALLRGQARFDVAHDVERPFSVLADGQKVIATGTAFNIDVTGARVVVTLIQGHVVVLNESAQERELPGPEAPSPRHHTVELAAGQQLAVTPDKPPAIAHANIQRVTAWTSGQLMFDNEPLADVVARVNRYSATPIMITDPKVAALRISGVFNTGDVSGFVDIVTRYLPVEAVTEDSGAIVLKTKA
ncbi:MAG: FecR domain-containing protein [Rhizomicrobium sp.]